MRSALCRTGSCVRTIALAVGLIGAASSSQAANLVSYHTSGSIGTSGISGPGGVGYTSIGSGSFMDPSQFSLGEFLVPGLKAGETATYSHTPFEIQFEVNTVNGTTPAPSVPPIKISGELNGSIKGSNQSNLVATFLDVLPPSFLMGQLATTLTLKNPSLSLVPSTSNGGRTTIQAYLVATGPTVPEPASITLFVAAIAGLGARRRFRAQVAA